MWLKPREIVCFSILPLKMEAIQKEKDKIENPRTTFTLVLGE
jgi:hypothetical protein